MNTANIWVIDDDHAIRWVLEKALSDAGHAVTCFEDADQTVHHLNQMQPDVIISDIRMPGTNGLDFLNKLRDSHPDIPVIIMTAHSDLESAVTSYQTGAFEYLPKPFDLDEVLHVIERAIQHSKKNEQQMSETTKSSKPTEIIGESPAMQEVFRAIGRLSQSNITVLIHGESGTGKELVAHALHRHSPRKSKAFIALNMAAIPPDLIEAELFGHEKGAFTGANSLRQGRFEQANGGTLFLDEIGDMPFETQTRLLRVLANGEFYRLGGHTAVKVNVRIIAATHQNLEKLVIDGKFREDLFHRLNVIRIHIPKLNQRSEDIPKLATHFLNQAAKELNVSHKLLRPETAEAMQKLSWPGNVRQLENLCRWLTVMTNGRDIYLQDLPSELHSQIELNVAGDCKINANSTQTQAPTNQSQDNSSWSEMLFLWATEKLAQGQTKVLDQATPEFERTLIKAALQQTKGKKLQAAELLGWGRNTLTRKLKELDLEL